MMTRIYCTCFSYISCSPCYSWPLCSFSMQNVSNKTSHSIDASFCTLLSSERVRTYVANSSCFFLFRKRPRALLAEGSYIRMLCNFGPKKQENTLLRGASQHDNRSSGKIVPFLTFRERLGANAGRQVLTPFGRRRLHQSRFDCSAPSSMEKFSQILWPPVETR